MADIRNVFDVGARALSAQMVRMNTVASNLANADTVSGTKEGAFRALRPVFETTYADAMGQTGLATSDVAEVVMLDRTPEREFRPDHPAADKDGFVMSIDETESRLTFDVCCLNQDIDHGIFLEEGGSYFTRKPVMRCVKSNISFKICQYLLQSQGAPLSHASLHSF